MTNPDRDIAAWTFGQLVMKSLFMGTAIASIVPILLNVPIVEELGAILLFPGGFLGSLISPGGLTTHPLVLMSANVIFYGLFVLVLCLSLRRHLRIKHFFVSTRTEGVLAVLLFVLACVPRLNPLWPKGIAELHASEQELKDSIHRDMTIAEVRQILQRKSFTIVEDTQERDGQVFQNNGSTLQASAGDLIMFSHMRTNAVQYPCVYDLDVVVLFNSGGRIKQSHIAPAPVCP
jgi:hypothetical protein